MDFKKKKHTIICGLTSDYKITKLVKQNFVKSMKENNPNANIIYLEKDIGPLLLANKLIQDKPNNK